jgi:hypothetical protein
MCTLIVLLSPPVLITPTDLKGVFDTGVEFVVPANPCPNKLVRDVVAALIIVLLLRLIAFPVVLVKAVAGEN